MQIGDRFLCETRAGYKPCVFVREIPAGETISEEDANRYYKGLKNPQQYRQMGLIRFVFETESGSTLIQPWANFWNPDWIAIKEQERALKRAKAEIEFHEGVIEKHQKALAELKG